MIQDSILNQPYSSPLAPTSKDAKNPTHRPQSEPKPEGNASSEASKVSIKTSKKASSLIAKTAEVAKQNDTFGLLTHAKQEATKLQTLIAENSQVNPPSREELNTINNASMKTISTVYGGDNAFNKDIVFFNENGASSFRLSIKPPPIENTSDIEDLKQDIQTTLSTINEVQSKVQAKVDKDLEAFDYEDAKTMREEDLNAYEKVRQDDYDYQNAYSSRALQQELLFILR